MVTGSTTKRNVRKHPWNWLQLLAVTLAVPGLHWLHTPHWLHLYSGGFVMSIVVLGVLLGAPALFIQLYIGGKMMKGTIGIFSRHIPVLKGVGVALLMRMAIEVVVDQLAQAYTLLYMYESLKSPQPWATCDNDWNTERCHREPAVGERRIRATEEYFYGHAAAISSGIYETSGMVGHLVLALFLSWVLTAFVVTGGPRLFGWMATLLSSITVVSILVMLTFGWVYNAGEGKTVLDTLYFGRFNSTTNVEDHTESSSWIRAAQQLVLLLSLHSGLLPMFGRCSGGSRYKLHLTWVPLLVMSWLLPNVLVLMVAPYIRMWAFDYMFIHRGLPFALLTVPAVLPTHGISTYWSFVFFVVIYLLGVLHLSLILLVIISGIVGGGWITASDAGMPSRGVFRLAVSAATIAVLFLLGLLLVSHSGWYWYMLLSTFNDRLAFVYLLLLGLGSLVAYAKEGMSQVGHVVVGAWAAAAFLILTILSILVLTLPDTDVTSTLSVRVLDREYLYPTSAIVIGWLVAASPLVIGLVTGLVHSLCSSHGPVNQRMIHLFTGSSVDGSTWSIMDAFASSQDRMSTITEPHLEPVPLGGVALRLSENPERTWL